MLYELFPPPQVTSPFCEWPNLFFGRFGKLQMNFPFSSRSVTNVSSVLLYPILPPVIIIAKKQSVNSNEWFYNIEVNILVYGQKDRAVVVNYQMSMYLSKQQVLQVL